MGNVTILSDKWAKVKASLELMTSKACYVGIPHEETRDDGISNAQIAFINEFGSDHKNIPARPFMQPALKKVKERVIQEYKAGAKLVLQGYDMNVTYERVGTIARDAIKKQIVSGEGMKPLEDATIKARQYRRKSGKAGTKPLIDTGQMLNSITYVIKGA